MATTVITAFNEFLSEYVNLDSTVTTQARASRNWLLSQIQALPGNHADFPVLYPDVDIHYGSFARRTKIRELDDLDMIVGISGLGTTYQDYGSIVRLTVPSGIALRELCHDGTNLLNSRRVINKFVNYLSDISQYKRSEIKRNGVAAVLNLTSYTWCFDIVPGFFTAPEFDGRTYYIIPDGNGHWMKTDPRIDQERTTTVNQLHDGNVLNIIRSIKYWNRRPTMPTMPSYLLESLILNYYANRTDKASSFVDLEVGRVLTYLATAVLGSVQDPKQIQGDINTLALDARLAISFRANADTAKAVEARAAENAKNYELSINLWREVFGPFFPQYG